MTEVRLREPTIRQAKEAIQAGRLLFKPSPKQATFLTSTARECLIGGAVGGGKTAALAVAPLRWIYHPQHSAILLRRERDDLQEIIDRARDMYPQIFPHAKWVESRKRFEFPTGASILMGSAQHAVDIEQYKTFEFNWIGFDELTTFERYQYIYMLSRNRSKDEAIPLHVRAGTNPDGVGHAWVRKRFVDGKEPFRVYRYKSTVNVPGVGTQTITTTRQFVPSTVFDNPHLTNRDEYIAGLQAMGKELADALLYGKWDFFQGQMFPYGEHGGLKETDPTVKSPEHYVVRALDYGWTDPTVVQWLVVYPRLEELPVIEVAAELVAKETNVRDLAYLMQRQEDELARAGVHVKPMPRMSVADPAIRQSQGSSQGKSIFDLFQAQGVWFENAVNDRQAGWAQLRMLLEAGQIRVWRGKAPKLMDTLPRLARDPEKAEDILPKQDDHSADTLRYGCLAVVEGGQQSHPMPTSSPVNPKSQDMDQVYDKVVETLRKQQDHIELDPLDTFGFGF